MVKTKSVFICQECGRHSPNWLGRCPGCEAWNSFLEKPQEKTRPTSILPSQIPSPLALPSIKTGEEERFKTSITELDRVLGGGIVPGSLVLIGGEPGIGKSTLLLQAASNVCQTKGRVVYISGEETPRQVKLRAHRLGIKGEEMFLAAETNLDLILGQADMLKPALLVVDSIQSVYTPEAETLPGSLNQLRLSTQKLMAWAKVSNCPVFITGHVTKDGTIAGPRVLEHMVDAVLYLEGEPFQAYRILRSVKNRFGSTNEVGIFEMVSEGLAEIANPSAIFLSERLADTVGSAVVPTLEGSRPLLVEVQALTSPSVFGQPRRVANGVDYGRLLMLTAVLGRRCSLRLGKEDVIANATGGLRISEPAADLAIALAIASSYRDQPVLPDLTAVGEVGLSGELRAVPRLDRRLAEAARLGFKSCIVPEKGTKNIKNPDIHLITVSTLREAIRLGLREGKG
ncbi:MAG: DNA repair protein RadA [Dehalococcoidales bacterium]|jgi:DNA repair protein RadA/Sms|nr:DNA repair protein RadA [Dehalococcoidales bacterium]MDD4794210.1 DNA repair protein RadA [Dehalococcoidales bacterium]MDD5498475.1 DNA repair protein RadA [Dehalococcoidales bacterium]MDX9802965.1 DNA repair protein RadA [Dehalococcoidales bacterium]